MSLCVVSIYRLYDVYIDINIKRKPYDGSSVFFSGLFINIVWILDDTTNY